MGRLAGQIDQAKTEAILEAASSVMSERGLSASMGEIARRAGVSKQTIYNHYGSKAALIAAMARRRATRHAAPLEAPEAAEHPEEALASFAHSLLASVAAGASTAFMRIVIQNALVMPDVARAVFESGSMTTRRRLAEFLAREDREGHIEVPNPAQAAEFFAGMVIGSAQMAGLLGVGREPDEREIESTAREAAHRFLQAYRPARGRKGR